MRRCAHQGTVSSAGSASLLPSEDMEATTRRTCWRASELPRLLKLVWRASAMPRGVC